MKLALSTFKNPFPDQKGAGGKGSIERCLIRNYKAGDTLQGDRRNAL